jgi:hypothetical protein
MMCSPTAPLTPIGRNHRAPLPYFFEKSWSRFWKRAHSRGEAPRAAKPGELRDEQNTSQTRRIGPMEWHNNPAGAFREGAGNSAPGQKTKFSSILGRRLLTRGAVRGCRCAKKSAHQPLTINRRMNCSPNSQFASCRSLPIRSCSLLVPKHYQYST